MNRTSFLDLVNSHPMIYDGAMGATIRIMQLTPEDYGGKAISRNRESQRSPAEGRQPE